MNRNGRLAAVAVAAIALGVLQAWDSGAFGVGGLVAVLAVVAAFLTPLAVILSGDFRLHAAAIVTALGLLLAARLASPVPLNELFIVAVASFMPVLARRIWCDPEPLSGRRA
jgi:hypothetical protein